MPFIDSDIMRNQQTGLILSDTDFRQFEQVRSPVLLRLSCNTFANEPQHSTED